MPNAHALSVAAFPIAGVIVMAQPKLQARRARPPALKESPGASEREGAMGLTGWLTGLLIGL